MIAIIMSSAIVVMGHALLPGRIGMVSGLFFGFIFGIGGIGAALLGWVADWKGLPFAFLICSFLPAVGTLTVFLPDLHKHKPS